MDSQHEVGAGEHDQVAVRELAKAVMEGRVLTVRLLLLLKQKRLAAQLLAILNVCSSKSSKNKKVEFQVSIIVTVK